MLTFPDHAANTKTTDVQLMFILLVLPPIFALNQDQPCQCQQVLSNAQSWTLNYHEKKDLVTKLKTHLTTSAPVSVNRLST
jgi:hypothetical protein